MFDKKLMRYMALGSSISTSLVAPVVIGIYGGGYLDRRFGTGQTLSLIGMLLGLTLGILAVWQIIRTLERIEKRE